MNQKNTQNLESQLAKQHAILQLLRREGQASRFALSKALGISNSYVCALIEQLLGKGAVVEERAAGADRRGRSGVDVRLNSDYGQLLGFDMEAKRLRLVVQDFAGSTLHEFKCPVEKVDDWQDATQQIVSFIQDSLKQIEDQCPNILGLGLAASGIVDVHRGMILHYDLWPGVRDFPLRDLVASHTGFKTELMDNVQALTLAEWAQGAAQHLDSFICVAMRSGIGAGIVINGRLHTGSHGFAGEAGYLPVFTSEGASKSRTLQDVVSETALKINTDAKDFSLSDAQARRAGEIFGLQLAAMANLLGPQAFVLSGTLLADDGQLWDHVVRAFRRATLPELVERIQLLPARLGPFAAAHGAAHRCFQMLFPNGD